MLHGYPPLVLSAAVIFLISEIPLASPFSIPSRNISRRHSRNGEINLHHHDFFPRPSPPQHIVDALGSRVPYYASSLYSTAATDEDIGLPHEVSSSTSASVSLSASERIEHCKRDLIQHCNDHELGSGKSSTVEKKIRELEQLGAELGFGMESSLSGLISGEW